MEVRKDIQVVSHPQVYPPSEDTFLLLRAVEARRGESCVEVGCGSGLVALHMASAALAVATDVNPHAVALCRSAARRHRLPLEVVRTHLLTGLQGPFDVVAFNPPYLPQEGPDEWIDRAWTAGPTGDALALEFLRDVRRVLAPGGRIYLLLSSLNHPALAEAQARFSLRRVAHAKFDFETLSVYVLR